jgi:hypothetical protein
MSCANFNTFDGRQNDHNVRQREKKSNDNAFTGARLRRQSAASAKLPCIKTYRNPQMKRIIIVPDETSFKKKKKKKKKRTFNRRIGCDDAKNRFFVLYKKKPWNSKIVCQPLLMISIIWADVFIRNSTSRR